MSAKRASAADDFSFGKMVAYSLAAGVAVLVVAVIIIVPVAMASATAALIVAVAAIVVMLVVIVWVSRRMMAGLQAEIDARKAELAAREEQEN